MNYYYKVARKITFFILIFFCFEQYESCAITPPVDDVSNDLERIRVQYNMPGLSALALKHCVLVGQGASGYRLQNYSSPLLISDAVNIGSCSKWMTATLAGRLVDRKLLSWTTKIHECFSNYASFNSLFRNATLEQLLAHRAGVQKTSTFFDRHGLAFISQNGNISQIRRWVADTVLKDTPEVPPDEYLYSNQGYTVAAVMMEQVTGQDWESLIRQHVFIPLEMTSARIGPVYDNTLPPKAPVGHELLPNQTIPIPRPMLTTQILHVEHASSGPSGFVACSLHDFAKFLHAHVVGEKTGYLSAATATKLKQPYIGIEGYGLGVLVFNRTWALPGQALFHDGDAFGQNTVFWMASAKDLITISYTNCRSEDGITGRALDAAIGVVLAKYLNSSKNIKLESHGFIDENHF
ncbi:unnamed protein product [Rotaria socialis]|nr:unnamed protein product [Rotaria socialis]